MEAVITIIASGDLRLEANRKCWPAQKKVEELVTAAIDRNEFKTIRGHAYDPVKQHGFIDSQKYGMQVFRDLPADAPLIVVEAVWQYSHHVLPGLMTHKGPILTIANWSGEWPGLVGMLNLNGSLTKAVTSVTEKITTVNSYGCSKFQAQYLRRIFSVVTRARRASGSLPCIFAWVVER